MFTPDANQRPDYEPLLQQLADYALDYRVESTEALDTAHLCLRDSLGCALLALQVPECTRLLGPLVEGSQVPFGSRVPGTGYCMDPVQAAWDLGCLIRWLDFNDTWLAAEWGHPSDNLGAILAVTDHLAQRRAMRGEPALTMRAVFDAMVVAYEIQGVLALENAFNRVGLDHVLLVKLASCAVTARLLGANRAQMLAALSQVFADGQALRTYRHAPTTGSRKSWAAGDAASRGVFLAHLALRGEMGIPGVIEAPRWGFRAVSFPAGIRVPRAFGSYVMENILFKVRFPAEFHGQTACEAAIRLHPLARQRMHDISRILITTQESALRIIAKAGPLANPADRDHCLQYMVAVALLEGDVRAEHYGDAYHAAHPFVDVLRELTEVQEDPRYSRDYLHPDKRSIANAVQLFFSDGSCSERVEVEYPLGHRRRRAESLPLLEAKFRQALETRFAPTRCEQLLALCRDRQGLEDMPVQDFVAAWTA